MKTLLIILLMAAAGMANAKDLFSFRNTDGGKAVFTNNSCAINGQKFPGLFYSYTYIADGSTTEGCWKERAETIMVIWYPVGRASEIKNYPKGDYFKK